MIFQRENTKEVVNPSVAQLNNHLKRLRSTGPSSFAILTNDHGDYVQAAGGGGCLLERREATTGRHFRAFQEQPVVPFEDGTTLHFSAGAISLRSDEWFRLGQVVEVFADFLDGTCPGYVEWREVTEVFRGDRSG